MARRTARVRDSLEADLGPGSRSRSDHWVSATSSGGSTDAIELLDISDAARFLNVSETSLRRWTNDGLLPCLRIGGRRERRFRRADLLAFMEQPTAPQGDVSRKGDSTKRQSLEYEPVATIRGNHLCGIYGSDAGRLELAVPFLLRGLEKRSVCFLVAPLPAQKDILKAMSRKRSSLDSDIRGARLIVSQHQRTPAEQCRFFTVAMRRAEDEGADSFRVVGDMWGLRLLVSSEQMIELEVGFERLIVPRFPVVALCAYDARKFTGLELLDALKDHDDTFKFPVRRTIAQ
ncbi:MAG TPA: MEDS domain-containing protein [Gemmatimonadaceae bacterium]|nr:MEDS domain-containing protein [Gemmatimonadaceae bacterium]